MTIAIISLLLTCIIYSSATQICTEEFLLQRHLNSSHEPCETLHGEIADIYSLFSAFQGIVRDTNIEWQDASTVTDNDMKALDVLKWNTTHIEDLIRSKKTTKIDKYNSVLPHLNIFPLDRISITIHKDGTVLYSGPINEIPTIPSDRKWVFLFHGMGYPNQLDSVRDFLLKENMYVVIPDYSVGTHPLIYYPLSVYGIMALVEHLRTYMWKVLNPNPEDCIFIGHSFGGQVGGVLAKEVIPKRFIALDPAGPLFDYIKIPSLDVYSGERSLTIHTSVPWGSKRSNSLTDIFINDRRHKYYECHDYTMMCNHESSIIVFVEILKTKFVVYNEDIFYFTLDLDVNLRSGIYNTQNHLGSNHNTREPKIITSFK